MKYYYLWHGYPPKQAHWGREWRVKFEPPDVEGMVKLRGPKELGDWNRQTEGRCPDASFVVDFTVASGRSWPIFSARMKQFVEGLVPGDLQYLPFRLVNDPDKPKIPARTMYLGNVLTVVDCIDRQRTKVRNDDWTPRPNGMFEVRGPVWLRRSLIADERLFVIGGTPTMVLREDVKELIEAEGFRGVVIVQEMPVTDD
ncbi:hypothetical protein KOR34_17720 [Posidoniimonas corsicana]|uniref:Immunity MXAN-0049 protein domain-containing protein n=1 Tax=Posidoniimonas corsicana TaxID=1938618 RepID=A0A5C5VFU6_9BACT|nr:DUF1629 domain-containing protein [Posidoniimonas corsicana]TWT36827.1 hypothetical protein KOR34_17720 [Posidoniimonas corsicana]